MNYNIKPSTLYLITINSHVFRLKDDIKSLETLYKKINTTGLEIPNTYKILQDKTNDTDYSVCNSAEDIINTLEELSKEIEENGNRLLWIWFYGV